MGNIVLLDELTINKIAAGEVIERPASVIKEMVENSIDAGATNITIEIKNGGISYIRITDNGKGMEKDDLEIAFERHATSKIRSADDLNIVKSMGFRGEALASIAAIANVELCSKTALDDVGHKIIVEAGKVLEQEEIGCSKGTTITVKNLFFNPLGSLLAGIKTLYPHHPNSTRAIITNNTQGWSTVLHVLPAVLCLHSVLVCGYC